MVLLELFLVYLGRLPLPKRYWKYVFQMIFFRFTFNTSFGHLQDVLERFLACLDKTSLRHLVGVFLLTGRGVNEKGVEWKTMERLWTSNKLCVVAWIFVLSLIYLILIYTKISTYTLQNHITYINQWAV